MNDPRGDRLQLMLTSDEVQMLDDWRFSHRMPSRSAAVRELLRRGLAAEGFQLSSPGSKSKDFGVGNDGIGKSAKNGRRPPNRGNGNDGSADAR